MPDVYYKIIYYPEFGSYCLLKREGETEELGFHSKEKLLMELNQVLKKGTIKELIITPLPDDIISELGSIVSGHNIPVST